MKRVFLFVVMLLVAGVSSAQQSDNFIEIGNGHIRLRQDLTRGGAICYLSLAVFKELPELRRRVAALEKEINK